MATYNKFEGFVGYLVEMEAEPGVIGLKGASL